MLSSNKKKRRSAYIDFVSPGAPWGIKLFYALKNIPSILGTDSFKERAKKRVERVGKEAC